MALENSEVKQQLHVLQTEHTAIQTRCEELQQQVDTLSVSDNTKTVTLAELEATLETTKSELSMVYDNHTANEVKRGLHCK